MLDKSQSPQDAFASTCNAKKQKCGFESIPSAPLPCKTLLSVTELVWPSRQHSPLHPTAHGGEKNKLESGISHFASCREASSKDPSLIKSSSARRRQRLTRSGFSLVRPDIHSQWHVSGSAMWGGITQAHALLMTFTSLQCSYSFSSPLL